MSPRDAHRLACECHVDHARPIDMAAAMTHSGPDEDGLFEAPVAGTSMAD